MSNTRKLANDFASTELDFALSFMRFEVNHAGLPKTVSDLFEASWHSFMQLEFTVKSNFKFDREFSWQKFVRRYLTCNGFVGFRIDYLYLLLLANTNYPKFKLILLLIRLLHTEAFRILKHRVFLRNFKRLKDVPRFGEKVNTIINQLTE